MSSRGQSGIVTQLARVIPTVLLLALACVVPPSAFAAGRPGLGPSGPLPLAFEPNQGQADPAVRFLARGRGYALFFTGTEAVLVLTPTQPATGRRALPADTPSTPPVVRMRLVGASPTATLTGLEPLPGRSHYFVGGPSRWQRDVPTFGRLRYEDVYPGVNLVFYGTERELEYDLLVAPGVDPGAVALAFDGADGLRVDESGDLLIATAAGELRLRRPVIYEEGDDARRKLDGGYVVDGGRVRFHVAGRDARHALVIDPVLGYSAFVGGSGVDQGVGIAVDTAGNAYVTGVTASANFPVSVTAVQPGRAALTDAFVTKLDPTGAVVYSTYLGGSGDEAGSAIAVDALGNAYVTGTTTSNDFPTVGPFQPTLRGGRDAFVAKLDPNGATLVYSTYLGGEADDFGFGIALDGAGNAYVTGSTASLSFPNNSVVTCVGSRRGPTDAFVAKVNVTGSSVGYCAFVGGSGDDSAAGIAADAAGNVWIAGSTTSTETVVGGPQTRPGGGTDAFVAMLDTTGTLVYQTYLGGDGEDHATAIAVDNLGSAYVTGSTTSTNFPTQAPFQGRLAGGSDAFVTKLTPAGNAFVFSTYLGGVGADVGNGIAVNPVDGTITVVGSTGSGDFPTRGAFQSRLAGGLDVFVTKLDATGDALVYSTYMGGTGDDVALALAVDANGVAFVTGTTNSSTFPVSPGQILNGGIDAFVAQIGDGGTIQFSANNYTVAENGGSATISVQRTGDLSAQVTVDYVTSDGTATAGADYVAASGTLTFAPGQIIATFAVGIIDNTIGDGDRTVNLTLRNPTGGAVVGARRTATLTILDDESSINFGASIFSVNENKGPAVITVTRSGPATATGTVTVRFSTSDGTATAPTHYAAVNTTLTFAAGVRSVKVSVPIVNETVAEGTHTVNLTLSNVTGGTPPAVLGVRSSAVLNILDDDVGGNVQFSQPIFTVAEPTTGTATATITVTRAGGAASNVTVDYAVSDGLPPNGASNGKNFVGTSGTLTFGAGQTSQTFTVTVRSDGAATGDLFALLSLSNPTGGAMLGSFPTAALKIVDSAPRFSFSTDMFTVKEGTPTATITVIRTGPATTAATVDFTTTDGSATAGVDYQAVAGTLSFPAGTTSKTFTVPIINNTSAAGTRVLFLTLGNPTPATMSIVPPAQATLAITEDDLGGLIAFAGPAFVVAQSAGPATVAVSRTGGLAGGATVQFATSDGTAVAGTDYVGTSGTLTFGPNETTKTFPVTILVPASVSGVRTVNLTLSTPGGGATLGVRATAVLRIVDQLSIAFSSPTYTVNEGGTATITVELAGVNVAPVTVDFLASDGSARQPADYKPTSGTLTFPAGGTATSLRTRTFTVPVLQNTTADGTKTINLSLSNATGGATLVTAPVNRSTAVLSILDDDVAGMVAFSAPSFTFNEGAGTAVISVKRTMGNASGVTVDYATSDGTATAGTRYLPAAGRLTFGLGDTVKTFTVPLIDDAIAEGPQTVNLTLTNPGGGATLGSQATAVLTIDDNEPYIALSAPTYSVAESAGSLTVMVLRGGNTTGAVSIKYATQDQPIAPNAAVAGVDYMATSGTLSFAVGVTSLSFNVSILDNSLPQPDRNFNIVLSNPLPAGVGLIAPASAVATIKDDDIGGVIQLSAPTYTVKESGGEAILTLTRTAGRAGGVSVRVVTGDSPAFVLPPGMVAQTATAGTNYTSVDTRVTFGPGDTQKTVRIPILTDGVATGNLTIYVQVSDPQPTAASRPPALGAQTLAVVTFVDAQPTVQFPQATVTATEGKPVATVTVQRTAPVGRLSVDFFTTDGTATSPAYYRSTAGTLVFEAGVTSQSFTVPLVDNQAIEVDKQFTVTLTNLVPLTPSAAGTTLGPRTTANVLIKEDDRGGMFVVTGGTILEGAQNQNSTFLATVSRTGGTGGPVLIHFTADECGLFGSSCKFPATRNVDFDPINMDLTFLPGELSKTVPIVIHGNDIPQGSRSFQLTLSNGRPSVMQDGVQIGPLPQIGDVEAFVEIVEDDLYFVFLSSETYQVPENSGQLIVPVIRSGLATRIANPLAVDVIAVATGAVAGLDYVSLGVFDGQSALLPGTPGQCGFLAGKDLIARQSVVFAANQTTTTFRVPILDDTIIDGPKLFAICINDAQGTGTASGPGIAFPASAVLTVNDDDNGGVIEFGTSTYVVPETAAQAIITLVRTGNPSFASNATVIAQTGDLFAATTPPQTGVAGVDYTSTSVLVSFAAGATTTSFTVPLFNSAAVDGGKTVNLRIVNPQPQGFPGSPSVGTRQTAVLQITDAAQSVDFAQANYDVGEAAGQAMVIIERGGDVSAPLTVDFTTSDNTAVAGVDYQAVTTTVTFAAGSGTVLVPVPIIDNNFVNADKLVNLTLSNPGPGATLVAGRTTATITIKDDDVGGTISFASATFTAPEPPGPPGTTALATVTIFRTGGTAGCPLPLGPPPSCPDATLVTFSTSNGTATAGTDYTATTTTVEFGAGESIKTVTVPIISDGGVDGTQTVALALTNPQPAGFMGHSPVLGSQATATLQITETEIRVGAMAYAYSETSGRATVTLVREGSLTGAVSVDFNTVNGAAIAGADYTATSGTLTFADGESVKTLDVILINNGLFEGDASFEVVFSNPVGTTIAGDSCKSFTPPAPALVATCTIDIVIVDEDAGGVIEFSQDTFDVNENAGTATVTVKRTVGGAGCPLPLTVPTPPGGSCPGATLVTFTTSDGTAVAGTDYTATTTTVEFGANEVMKTVTVPVLNNTTGVQTANLTLTNATGGAAIGNQDTAKLRIIDVNDSVGFTALGYTVNESGVNAVIGVRRTGLVGNVVVNYLTSPGTATAGADYTAVAGALTLPPATVLAPITTGTIMVPIINDSLVEPNETFTVRLQGLTPLTAVFDPAGCNPASPPGTCDTTVTIIDDDQGGVITFAAATYQVNEGAAGGTASILLRRTGGLGGPVTVTFATSNGTAVAGTDYGTLGSAVPPSSTVTFAAGQTAVVATVPILVNGTVDAAGRTVNLTLSNPQPAGLPGSPVLGALPTATLTINDDDSHLSFTTPTFSVVEGAPAAPITVRRTGNTAVVASVTVATSDGSALAGTDYGTLGSTVPPSGTLTFLAGETVKTFLVPIIDNNLLDGTRTLSVTLSGAVNAGIDCAGVTVPTCTVPLSIHDDDRAGSVAFDASIYSVKEDAVTLNVIITRTGGKGSGVTVRYAAVDGTALNGTDYTAPTVGAPGSVTFLANETAKTVPIPIVNRAGAQGGRSFLLVLCDGAVCAPAPTAGATLILPTQTAVTIVDKDTEQTVQFSAQSYSISEAAGSATITVQRLGNPVGTLSVDFTSSSGVAKTLTFLNGVRSQTVAVPIVNNTAVDGDRTITLTLTNLTGVPAPGITCGGATALSCSVPLLVVDDDVAGLVQFATAAYRVTESTPTATVTLTRTGGSAGPVSVELALDPPLSNRVGTPTPNPVVFGPGVMSRTVTIPILNNTVVDGNVDILLRLTNPLNGVALGALDTAKLTIVDDDIGGVMQFSQALYTVTEPAAPPALATITVTRSGGAASGVTVDYATSDVGPCPPPPGTSYACAGTNYVATSGTLTFAAGQTSQTFTVSVLNDGAATGNIPLNLTLTNPGGGGTLGARSAATLKIIDIQAAVGFAATTYSVTEGGSAMVTVERTGPVGLPGTVTVHYATSDGTATSGGLTPDYRATSGNLTFNPGVGILSFSVPTVGDSRQQGNRAFNVTLTPVLLGGGTTLVRNAATVTILDNDVAGAITFSNAAYASAEFGFVTVGLRRPSNTTAGPVTVAYTTVDGSAKAGVDYVAQSGTVTFAAGVTAVDFTVAIIPNTIDDGNRTFSIVLSSPTGGATMGSPSTATVQIHNDDVAGTVQWSVVSFSASRTCAVAPCTAALVLKRFGGGASGVTVDYATVDGTGNALHDYLPVTDTATFGSGETLKTIRIPLRPGATVGSNFGVVLSNPQGNASLGTQSTATVTITP